MKIVRVDENKQKIPIVALLYCAPGVGKSTALGIIAEQSMGRTLILDVDRTILPTLRKNEIVHDMSKIDIAQIEVRTKSDKCAGTFAEWTDTLISLEKCKEKMPWENICIDNISELERCILSDLGAQGKNKGVPAQADYQYMQFKLVNSLRFLRDMGVNIFMTAWETTEQYIYTDGTSYSRSVPKISAKILDNICGLCNIVGKIAVNEKGQRGIVLDATTNIYAKNQIDSRKGCLVEEFYKTTEGK
jgi:phage nucleotide-binding protein